MGFWCVLPVPAQTRSLLPLLILFYKSTFHSSTANFPTVCGLSPVKLLPHYPSTQIWRNQRNQTCLTSRTLLSTSSGCTCTVKSREIRLAWQWILTPPICRSITILVVYQSIAVCTLGVALLAQPFKSMCPAQHYVVPRQYMYK